MNAQPSFTEHLERLHHDQIEQQGQFALVIKACSFDIANLAEGGADCWERPPLAPIDPKRDTISMCLVF